MRHIKQSRGNKMQAERIVSIKKIGLTPTVDIEVNNKHHLFFANGVVTSNSHSLSYALISYVTAYIKAHFPLQFYKSWLKQENDREEYPKLINEAKLFNIEVHPPDIRFFKPEFHSLANNIYFGLHNIKGIVKKDLDNLAAVFTEKEWSFSAIGKEIDWLQFLSTALENVSSKTAEGLILSGALDCFSLPRARMLYEYERWNRLTPTEKRPLSSKELWEGTSLDEYIKYLILDMEGDYKDKMDLYKEKVFKRENSTRQRRKEPKPLVEPKPNRRLDALREIYRELTEPLYSIEDTTQSLIFAEENLLGVTLTKHKTDEIINCAENANCLEVANGKKGYSVLRVKIDQARPWNCKGGQSAGKAMCFLEISDKSSKINAVIFPEQYEQYQHLLTRENLVFVAGQLGKERSFIINKVYPVS